MNRRDAISAVSFLVGGTIIGAESSLTSCSGRPAPSTPSGFLTNDQISFLDEVAETILPTTPSSPGAKEAKVGAFMDIIVKDCYSPGDQKIFVDGIQSLENASKTTYDKSFLKLSPEEKHAFLLKIDGEASTYKEIRKPEDPENHYYSMVKQLTLLGYFTSEIGSTKALNHVAVPGRYEACVPLKSGQKAWS